MKGAAGWRRSARSLSLSRIPGYSDHSRTACSVLSCYRSHSSIFIFSLSGTMKRIFTRIFHTFTIQMSSNFGFHFYTGWKTSVLLTDLIFDFIPVMSTIRLGEQEVRQGWTSGRHPGPSQPDSSRYL